MTVYAGAGRPPGPAGRVTARRPHVTAGAGGDFAGRHAAGQEDTPQVNRKGGGNR